MISAPSFQDANFLFQFHHLGFCLQTPNFQCVGRSVLFRLVRQCLHPQLHTGFSRTVMLGSHLRESLMCFLICSMQGFQLFVSLGLLNSHLPIGCVWSTLRTQLSQLLGGIIKLRSSD